MIALVVASAFAVPSVGRLVASATPPDTSCPISKLPAKPQDAPWDSATYQAKYSPTVLADQVMACEQKFNPQTALLAEVGVIGLNYVDNKTWQNQDMWLADASGDLTAQHDFENLGIPAISLEDGPGGIIYEPPAGQNVPTVFPNEMALASSMDPTVAEAYGDQLGEQANAFHYMGVQAPDLNIDRIPNWGRIFETFGESPVLAGQMGAAETIGILQSSPLAVLKHIGIYGQETSRRSINWTVSPQALYNTYLRSFFIAANGVADSASVPADRLVALMCSYGDLNGVRTCASHTLQQAESYLPFSGIVRSDLDTVTTAPALLRAGISLIKPLDADEFIPTSKVSASNRSLIAAAATKVIAAMFAAGTVNAAYLHDDSDIGTLSNSLETSGRAVALNVEKAGAVLLKDTAAGHAGSLPLAATGPLAIMAPIEMAQACQLLAGTLHKALKVTVSCTVWNNPPEPSTTILGNLPHGTNNNVEHATTTWIAPETGWFVVNNVTFGNSALYLDGKLLQDQPGTSEIYNANDSTLYVKKGQKLNFKEAYEALGPTLQITPIQGHIGQAVAVAKAVGADHGTVLVLADDYSAEGADLDELNLPAGQDALIESVDRVAPTSVALFTTGPVLMPWLNEPNLDSVMELWNPGGLPPFGNYFQNYVPAFTQLLDGAAAPEGRLPITFPASATFNPMDFTPAGAPQYSYWPGVNQNANLDLAPNDGQTIGYEWYAEAGFPVLFPFGYGLSYNSATYAMASNPGGCSGADTATSLCVPITATLSGGPHSATGTAELFMTPPPTAADPATDQFVGAQVFRCPSGEGSCSAQTADLTVTALEGGDWSTTTNSFAFTPGCYTFAVAINAKAADAELADPAANPTTLSHATYPFDSSTTLAAGGCPS